ncbi:MAG: hypothetical protein WAZ19_09760 [Anaerolineae bacterium]
MESLTDYLLIAQDRALVEHRARQSGYCWLKSFYMGLENTLPIASLGIELATTDLYDKIAWPDEISARGWLRAIKDPVEA